jgi:hypothetical protein
MPHVTFCIDNDNDEKENKRSAKFRVTPHPNKKIRTNDDEDAWMMMPDDKVLTPMANNSAVANNSDEQNEESMVSRVMRRCCHDF